MRRPIIAGNWKMYKTLEETYSFFEAFRPLVAGSDACDIVVFPTYVNLQAAAGLASGSNINIGAQNCYWKKDGAYTGEVSVEMLKAVGCSWVLIAHSERRQYFGETDATALKKTVAALDIGLTPIVCVGELLEEREAGHTESVLTRQFADGVAPLSPEQFSRIVLAYEPVWAIGTGKTATPQIAAAAHRSIRALIQARFGDTAASQCRILYGGSVKPDNIEKLLAEPEIDGALVGGASLNPESFASLVHFRSSN